MSAKFRLGLPQNHPRLGRVCSSISPFKTNHDSLALVHQLSQRPYGHLARKKLITAGMAAPALQKLQVYQVKAILTARDKNLMFKRILR
jgi:hypothetical protein